MVLMMRMMMMMSIVDDRKGRQKGVIGIKLRNDGEFERMSCYVVVRRRQRDEMMVRSVSRTLHIRTSGPTWRRRHSFDQFGNIRMKIYAKAICYVHLM